jgi:choline-sulfatase
MPTALELAGAQRPPHVFFHSLLPLLNAERQTSPYESIYGAYLELQRAVTHDGWKLIAYPQVGVLRLYDLTADPLEMTDLADDPRQASRKSELFRRLVALQGKLGDKLDLGSAFPQR